jgi:phosphohistidine phosphatase
MRSINNSHNEEKVMLELFIIRHAIAEEREVFSLTGHEDSQRPLTAQGIKKFKKTSEKLKKLIGPVDLIVSSPLVRAQQTADLLMKQFPHTPNSVSQSLLSNAHPNEFIRWCKENLMKSESKVIIVGHEPHLSRLTCWLLFGSQKSCIELKKGGCIKLKFNNKVETKHGVLCWLISPKCLKVNSA